MTLLSFAVIHKACSRSIWHNCAESIVLLAFCETRNIRSALDILMFSNRSVDLPRRRQHYLQHGNEEASIG